MRPTIRFTTCLGFAIIVMVILVQPSLSKAITTVEEPVPEEKVPLILLKGDVPVWNDPHLDHEASSSAVSLSAQSAIAIDVTTGAELFSYQPDLPLPPASVTKLMTALVARDLYYLDQILTVKEEAFTLGHVVQLHPGESLSVRSLLKAVLIQSGNDAAFVLANNHPEGYQGFIDDMNLRAEQLGLERSLFKNASGLDDDGHVMTAREISLVLREVMKDPFLLSVISQTSTEIEDVSGLSKRVLYTTHQLLNRPFVVGGKTGTTPLAGEVLTSIVDIKGHQVIITVMASQDRYQDTLNIYEWLNQQVNWLPVEESGLLDYN